MVERVEIKIDKEQIEDDIKLDILAWLQSLLGSKEGKVVGLPFKVAIGRFTMDKQGWVKVKYVGIDGKEVIFNEVPTVSVTVSGASGKISKPDVKVKPIKVDIKVPKVEIKLPKLDIPLREIQGIPKIHRIEAKYVELPKLEAKFKATMEDGEVIEANTRENLVDKVINWQIAHIKKTTSWGIGGSFNWLRDAILDWIYGGIFRWLMRMMGKIHDVIEGNTIPGFIKDATNKVIDTINEALRGIVDSTNKVIEELNKQIDSLNTRVIGKKDQKTGKYPEGSLNFYLQQLKEYSERSSKEIERGLQQGIDNVSKGIQQGINETLERIRASTEQSIVTAVDSIWKLIGLAEGIVFQPAVIRNVGREGFEVYSTGKGTTCYYIAIGK